MTRVLLIRHGETPWNREQRWQGHADVPLTPEGERQARELPDRLRERGCDLRAVYTSDLARAVDTARPIASSFGLEPVLDPAWREMDVGSWSGLRRDEIQIRFREEWARIVEGEDLPRGGGETFGAFTGRVVAALDGLRDRHRDETVGVVTHGGVVRAVLLRLRGLPFGQLRHVTLLENASFAELSSSGNGWEIVPETHPR